MAKRIISAEIPERDQDIVVIKYSDHTESEETLFYPENEIVQLDSGIVNHSPDKEEWEIIDAEFKRFSKEVLNIEERISFENIATDWIHKNIVLAEHCDIEYQDVVKSLTKLLDSIAK